MADRQVQAILNSGEITSVKLGGTTSNEDVLTRSEIAGITDPIDTRLQVVENPWHGVINPGTPIITINADTTKYDIAAFDYYIDGVKYSFPATTLSGGFGSAGDFIDIGVDSSSTGGVPVLKINNFFDSTDLSTTLEIGRIASADGTNITSIGDSVFFVSEFIQNLYIRFKSFEGAIFDQEAGLPSENGTTPFQLDIASGDFSTANMQVQQISAETNLDAFPVYNVSGTTAIRTKQTPLVVTNTQYDNGTDLAAIPSGQFVSHTLFRSSGTQQYYLEYGRILYTNADSAKSGILENYLFDISGAEVEPLAKIIVQEGASQITAIVDVRNTSKFRNNLVPTLQSAYSNSTVPQIVLDAGKRLEIRNDATDSNDPFVKITDNAGTESFLELTKIGLVHKPGWKDNIIPFFTAGTGPNKPTQVTDVNGWERLSFTTNNEVFIDFHINHDYAQGTNGYPHIHWCPTTTMAVGETVIWEFSYIIAKGHAQGQSVLGSITTFNISFTADGTEIAGEHIISEAADIDAFDLIEPDTIISAKVKRVAGTYGSAIYGMMADLHYQADREDTPQKTPDFYAP